MSGATQKLVSEYYKLSETERSEFISKVWGRRSLHGLLAAQEYIAEIEVARQEVSDGKFISEIEWYCRRLSTHKKGVVGV